jgi:hypothetical protein
MCRQQGEECRAGTGEPSLYPTAFASPNAFGHLAEPSEPSALAAGGPAIARHSDSQSIAPT